MTTDELKKAARKCHSRVAWSEYFSIYGQQIGSINHSGTLKELIKLLDRDQQFEHLAPNAICTILKGCRSSWDLKLGTIVAERALNIKDSQIAVLAAKVFLEAGSPLRAREIAQKANRSKLTSADQKLELDTILCNTFIDEGNRPTALRLLSRMSDRLSEISENKKELVSEIEMYLGRTYFLLGRYIRAAESFRNAGQIFVELNDWENAAKAYFNTSASLDNAGGEHKIEAFGWVEKCRVLAIAKDLRGPLAHCEAFYGHNDYWQGNFAGAREHFRQALSLIPHSVAGYRRLHLLSMLAFTYLRTGKYALAEKFGNETLRLARGDQADRFTFRFYNLNAEILWERKSYEESQLTLIEGILPLVEQGVHTLEELSTLSRYYTQSSLIGQEIVVENPNIDEALKNNESPWCEYLHACGVVAFAKNEISKAEEFFSQCLETATSKNDQYQIAKSILGLIQVDFANNNLKSAGKKLGDFQVATAKMIDSPLKIYNFIVAAAIAYRNGQIADVSHHLRYAERITHAGRAEKMAVKAWIAALDGHSGKLNEPFAPEIVAKLSKWFFAPNIESLGDDNFVISSNYQVTLKATPHLSLFLRTLLGQRNFEMEAAQLYQSVWQLSTKQQGWQQKIRNTVQRLRELFGPTIAPLFINTEGKVKLFGEAIVLTNPPKKNLDIKEKIVHLLEEGPMSSIQLSNKLSVSPATAKRALKDLVSDENINKMKVGRRIYYGSISQ